MKLPDNFNTYNFKITEFLYRRIFYWSNPTYHPEFILFIVDFLNKKVYYNLNYTLDSTGNIIWQLAKLNYKNIEFQQATFNKFFNLPNIKKYKLLKYLTVGTFKFYKTPNDYINMYKENIASCIYTRRGSLNSLRRKLFQKYNIWPTMLYGAIPNLKGFVYTEKQARGGPILIRNFLISINNKNFASTNWYSNVSYRKYDYYEDCCIYKIKLLLNIVDEVYNIESTKSFFIKGKKIPYSKIYLCPVPFSDILNKPLEITFNTKTTKFKLKPVPNVLCNGTRRINGNYLLITTYQIEGYVGYDTKTNTWVDTNKQLNKYVNRAINHA